MSTVGWIIIAIVIAVVLAIIFRKHLAKIGIGIGILIAGWIGFENPETIPDFTDDGTEQPVDSINIPIEKPIDTLTAPIDSLIVDVPVDTVVKQKVFHITLEGSGDLTTQLQDKIDAIPDGTAKKPNVIKLPKGEFWTEGDLENNYRGKNGILRLENRNHLIIDGTGTTLYTKAPAVPYDSGKVSAERYSMRRHVWIIRSNDITVKGLRIEGSNTVVGKKLGTAPEFTPPFWITKNAEGVLVPAPRDGGAIGEVAGYRDIWEQEHAFDIRGSTNVVLDGVEVYGVWGDAVYIGAGAKYVDSLGYEVPVTAENIVVRNSHLKFAGRQGICLANNVNNVLVEYNVIEGGRRASLDWENDASDRFITNTIIRYNKLHSAMTVFAALGEGDVSNVYFHDNEYSGGHMIICYDSTLKHKTRRKNWRVENNVRTNWFGSPLADIRFGWTDNIIIKNNTLQVSDKQSRTGWEFTNCGGEIEILQNNTGFANNIMLFGENTSIEESGNYFKGGEPVDLELKHMN